MVSFEVGGGLASVRKVSDAFRVITSTVSLGEVDTVAAHPASSSHRGMDEAYRQRYGITDGLIRLSVGIEDAEDLKEDLDRALSTL
jgi:cystathionine beta-lyase/cystathionine gamma-synthase